MPAALPRRGSTPAAVPAYVMDLVTLLDRRPALAGNLDAALRLPELGVPAQLRSAVRDAYTRRCNRAFAGGQRARPGTPRKSTRRRRASVVPPPIPEPPTRTHVIPEIATAVREPAAERAAAAQVAVAAREQAQMPEELPPREDAASVMASVRRRAIALRNMSDAGIRRAAREMKRLRRLVPGVTWADVEQILANRRAERQARREAAGSGNSSGSASRSLFSSSTLSHPRSPLAAFAQGPATAASPRPTESSRGAFLGALQQGAEEGNESGSARRQAPRVSSSAELRRLEGQRRGAVMRFVRDVRERTRDPARDQALVRLARQHGISVGAAQQPGSSSSSPPRPPRHAHEQWLRGRTCTYAASAMRTALIRLLRAEMAATALLADPASTTARSRLRASLADMAAVVEYLNAGVNRQRARASSAPR